MEESREDMGIVVAIDMDGTLARPLPRELFCVDPATGLAPWEDPRASHFEKAEPDPYVTELARLLLARSRRTLPRPLRVAVLTHVHPSAAMAASQVAQKRAWLDANGLADVELVAAPQSESKARRMMRWGGVDALTPDFHLIDDYDRNLTEWMRAGGAGWLWPGASPKDPTIPELDPDGISATDVVRLIDELSSRRR